MSSSLPLWLRPPNPSSHFVGRDREVTELRALLDRAPLVLLCGPAGIGKSATVLATVPSSSPRARTVFVPLGRLPDEVPPDRELLQALAAAASVTSIAWSSLLRTPGRLTEVLLDLAEEAKLTVILDGVRPSAFLDDLLLLVATYARASKWLVTCEEPFRSVLSSAPRLVLGSLDEASLHTLAASLAPDWDRARRHDAVVRSAGNPGALLQAIAPPSPPPVFVDPLAELTAAMRHGDAERAAAWLEANGAAALEEGHAQRIHRLVTEHAGVPSLARWAMRVAVEVGDLDAMPAELPAIAPPADRLLLLNAHLARGRLAEALEMAAALLRQSDVEPAMRAEARIVEARCLMMQGQVAEALAQFDAIEQLPLAQAVARDRSAAACLALLGRREEATTRLAQVRASAAELPINLRDDVLYGIANTLYALGNLREAKQVLEELHAVDPHRALTLNHHGFALYLRACIATDHGDLAEARELLERVRPFARSGSLLTPFYPPLEGLHHLSTGELDGLPARAEQALAVTAEHRCDGVQGWAAVVRIEAGIELGAPYTSAGWAAPLIRAVEHGNPTSPLVQQSLRRWALRTRRTYDVAEAPYTAPEQIVARALVDAEEHVLQGAGLEALRSLRHAIDTAARAGYRVREAEARTLLVWLLSAAGQPDEAREQADLLFALATDLQSARYRDEAEFAVALGHGQLGARKLAIWARSRVAPSLARRACALLGRPSAAPDALEAWIWPKLAAVLPFTIEHSGPSAEPPHWGFDDTRTVWQADGESVDLQSAPILWKLLTTLWEHGGRASKEMLVRSVWSIPDYHPLRDDNRLQVMIRKLRKRLGDEPARRIVTTDDGYAFFTPAARTVVRVPKALGFSGVQ